VQNKVLYSTRISFTSKHDNNALSLILLNYCYGMATSMAFFRHLLITTRLLSTNHCEGLNYLALAECESVRRECCLPMDTMETSDRMLRRQPAAHLIVCRHCVQTSPTPPCHHT